VRGGKINAILERIIRLQLRIADNSALSEVREELDELSAAVRELDGNGSACQSDCCAAQDGGSADCRDESTLYYAECRYRSLHDNLPLGVFRSTPEGEFLSVNHAMAAMFGFESTEEILRVSVPELYSDPQRRTELVNRLAAKGSYTDTEIQMRKKDGTILWVSSNVFATTDEQGTIVHFDGILQDITGRKLAVEALQQSEQFNRAVVENSPIGISVRNRTGRLLDCNDSWKKIWRISDENLHDYLHRERSSLEFDERDKYLGKWLPEVHRIYEEGGQLHVTELHLNPSRHGEDRWLSQFFYALKDGDGAVHRVIILTEDITERKQTELALQASEEKYRTLIEQSIQGIIIAQGNPMQIVFANQACVETVGYSAEEMLMFSSTNILTKLHPDDRDRVMAIYRDRMQGKPVPSRYELRFLRRDGSCRWLEVTSNKIEYEGKPAVQAIFVDRTEQKQAAQALEKSRARYRDLVEYAPVSIFTLDLTGVITSCNSAFETISGYSKNEIAGRHFSELSLLQEEDFPRYKEIMQACFAGKSVPPTEIEWVNRDGSLKTFVAHVQLIEEGGKPVGLQVISLDITDRKRAEVELRRAHQELEKRVAERTARLSNANIELKQEIESRERVEKKLRDHQRKLRFLSSELTLAEERERRRIATELHDGIAQSLALAKIRLAAVQEELSSHDLAGILAEVRNQIENTIQCTRSLTFDLSPPVLYDLGLNAAVEWLAEDMGKRHNLDITFSDDGKTGNLAEDIRVTLFQATRELLTNVVKHSGARWAQVTMNRVEDRVLITVEDDGVGFDHTANENRRDGGGRFGLFSIRERLQSLGGSLAVDAPLGQGSRITLTAPLNNTNDSKRES